MLYNYIPLIFNQTLIALCAGFRCAGETSLCPGAPVCWSACRTLVCALNDTLTGIFDYIFVVSAEEYTITGERDCKLFHCMNFLSADGKIRPLEAMIPSKGWAVYLRKHDEWSTTGTYCFCFKFDLHWRFIKITVSFLSFLFSLTTKSCSCAIR